MNILHKNFLILFGAIFLAIGIFIKLHVAATADLTVTKTIYVEKGTSPEPQTMARTRDNGFVIAGQSLAQAWAVRTDSEGKVVWRYMVPARETIPGERPRYSSVAIMPDDSVFICGNMPFNEPGVSSPGLLTHLDKNGKVLSEEFLYPPDKENASITRLSACKQFGNGIVVVGHTLQFVKNPSPEKSRLSTYKNVDSYFIQSFDGGGQVKWKKMVTFSDVREGADYISPLQAMPNGGFMLVSARSAFGTRIIHMSENGEVVATKMIDGTFVTALPVKEETDIQLVSKETESLTRITLNSDLKEIDRITEPHEIGEANMVYRLPDQSLIMFGDKHDKDCTYYQARVAIVDSKLKNEKTVLLGKGLESYWIQAGIPSDKSDEFISVRSATKHSNLGADATDEQLAEIRLGVGLDFISLKK